MSWRTAFRPGKYRPWKYRDFFKGYVRSDQKRINKMELEFTSRYGDRLPKNPATLCAGDCEGMGFIPVPAPADAEGPWRQSGGLVRVEDDPKYVQAWRDCQDPPGALGYKFITCPDCGGSGEVQP